MLVIAGATHAARFCGCLVGGRIFSLVSGKLIHCVAAAAGAAAAPGGQPDYLRQQREQRELAQRSAELDAKLRAVRLAEQPAGPLAPEVLHQLLRECARRQAVVEAAAVSRRARGSGDSRLPVSGF
jgi:hypothetical protein